MINDLYKGNSATKLIARFCKGVNFFREQKTKLVLDERQRVTNDDKIVVDPRITVTSTGKVFHVTGNARSGKEAIEALNCPVSWALVNTPEMIPLIIQPVDSMVRTASLGGLTKTMELFGLYPRVVSPMALFYFGAMFPEEQRQAPHFTVWLDDIGQFWFAILDVNGGKRSVHVNRGYGEGVWFKSYRLLVDSD